MNEILNCIYRLIVENLIGIASVVVMLLILWETRRWHRKESAPQLIYTLDIVNEYMVIGKLGNIGKGVAYNIKVEFDPQEISILGKNIKESFKALKYLGPQSSYNVQYGYLNIYNEVIDLREHKVVVSWTKKQKSKRKIMAIFFIGEGYFKSYPRKLEIAKQVKDLKDTVKEGLDNNKKKW